MEAKHQILKLSTPFQILEHTADLKIEVQGKDLADLFSNAALALMILMFGTEINSTGPSKSIEVKIKGNDLDNLMVNWLSEQLFIAQTEYVVTANITIEQIDDNQVLANQIIFPAVAIEDIKAVTYNQLKIIKIDNLFRAQITFDI